MTIHGRNFIAGEWVAGATTAPNINPSNTDDIVGAFARASAEEAQAAIDAAMPPSRPGRAPRSRPAMTS